MGFLKKLTNLFYVNTEEKKEVKPQNTQDAQPVQPESVNIQPQPQMQTQSFAQQFTQPSYQSNEYPISYPSNFVELEMLICRLRDSNKPMIISFANASPDIVQRFADILSGAALALNGTITDLPGNLHYFVPNKN